MTDDANAKYDVILAGFRTGDPAEHRESLAQAFGIPSETAAKFIAQIPTAVSRDVNRVRAEYFQRALEQAGAQAHIQAHGAHVPARKEAATPATTPMTATATASQPPPNRTLQNTPPNRTPPDHSATTEDAATGSLRYASDRSPALSRPPAANTLVAGSPAPHTPTAQAQPTRPRAKSPFTEASVVPINLQLTQLDAPDSVSYGAGTAPYASPKAQDASRVPADNGPAQWGALEGLSDPSPRSAAPELDAAAQEQFIPAEIEVSSGNLALSESPADAALELDDSYLPQIQTQQPAPPSPQPVPGSERNSNHNSLAPQSDAPLELLESDSPRPSKPSSFPPESSFPDKSKGPGLPDRLRDEYGNVLAAKGRRIEQSVWHALGVVFTGQGVMWIATLTASFALSLSVFHAATSVPGWLSVGGFIFGFLSTVGLIGLTAEFYEQVFWSSVKGRARLAGTPSLRPKHLTTGYLKAGTTLLALTLLGFGPAITALLIAVATGATNDAILDSRFLRLLVIAPLLYAPMALTTASMARRPIGSWSVPTGLRALFRAPLRYTFVTVSAGLAAAISSGMFAAVAAISSQPMWWLASLGMPVAVGTAISGAMMGDLVRDRPDLFR